MIRRYTLFLVLIWFAFTPFLQASDISLKVGIYNNAPKIFLTKDNEPVGFFVELLNAIADKNGWQLDYVPCEWDVCLYKLEKGEIDLLPDVAYSKEREKRFMFSREDVLSSWSVIYGRKSHSVVSILDLHHKRVAVLHNSIQYAHLVEQSKLLGIEPYFIETETINDAMNLLELKKVDLAVSNNFYDVSAFSLEPTNIIFNPVILKFAFSPTSPKELKQALDMTIFLYKKNTESPYYVAKKKWLDSTVKAQPLPKWVLWAGLSAVSILLVLLLLVGVFKYLLNLKIKELKKQEMVLIAQSRHAAMGEMISVIAHQWKQPLNVLSMAANNLRVDVELDALDAKSAFTYYESLTSQIQYLSHTIDDFSNFFKPNKEKDYNRDFNEIVTKTLMLVMPVLQSKHIEVQTSFEKIENVWIYGNELMQVLLNIINNAKDAFEQNAISSSTIKITTKIVDNTHVSIEIEDNAGGIKSDIIGKIFDPYFSTKEQCNGTGLGLYISKVIVEEHFKGLLKVLTHDKTTTFTLLLPLKEMREKTS